MITRILALYSLSGICATAQVLWKEPPPSTLSAWTWGPGGEEMAPRPPFRFVKERFGGTNPKVEVTDDAGRRWIVKFGSEVHSDTFQTRFVSALGYAAEPTYFVATGSIQDVHGLKRAKHFLSKDGSFHDARFKLHVSGSNKDLENKTWSWADNPFISSRELGGLKVLVMLTSNWDTKDARNGEDESNTGMIRPGVDVNSPMWYAVTDWGASLGRAGWLLKRDRWDWEGYRKETPNFVRMSSDGKLRWRYKGRRDADIKGVGLEDIRWILRYLSGIGDDNLRTGFTASGASAPVAQEYTRLIRDRIRQLQKVAGSSNLQQASR